MKNIRERIKEYGISTLTDEEILSELTGISITKLHEAIESFGIGELERYMETLEISDIQRAKLEMIYNISRKINILTSPTPLVFDSTKASGEYFVKRLRYLRNEVFEIALVNYANKIIKTVTLSKGTVSQTMVYPRDVVKIILDYNASSVIFAHNHVAGTMFPSSNDIAITKNLYLALDFMKIEVLDHIIVADNEYYSFADNGKLI